MSDPIEKAGFCARTVTVVDGAGWHARPATRLAKLVTDLRGQFVVQNITVNGTDASSVMELMGLGITCGESVTVEAWGENAQVVVDKIVGAIEGGLEK